MSSTCVEQTGALSDSSPTEYAVVRIHDPDVEIVARYAELTGLPFGVVHVETGMLTGEFCDPPCRVLPVDVLDAFREANGPHVVPHAGTGLLYYAASLPFLEDRSRLAAGCIPLSGASGAEQPVVSPEMLRRLLALAEAEVHRVPAHDSMRELDHLAGQLDAAYEELSLLHEVARNLRISLDPVELAHLCVRRLHNAVSAEGCAVLLDSCESAAELTVSGVLHFDESQLRRLLGKLNAAEHDWRRPMVRNHLGDAARSVGCDDVRNLAAAAILDGAEPIGWIVACNSESNDEFGTAEASLINSIALMLSTHLSNLRLFLEQEDLLIAFVRSLVSTLDAKDSYTRGHSERVARVALRLAKHLGLTSRDQEAIHLSGLLHDIGKIGVEDAILRKPQRLTDAEFRKLQLHPVIGADILSGLRNLRHIIPGVRHHHENFDGTGYPDRLSGEEIPLMARVLAVADAYDAMGSDRPYREGMSLEHVERILAEGAGTQWDPKVIRAYFTIRDEIARTWQEPSEPAQFAGR